MNLHIIAILALVDTRFLRKIDESGFIDRIYATSASR